MTLEMSTTPQTEHGLERARELRRIGDELDAMAAKQVERLQALRPSDVGAATHNFARTVALVEVLHPGYDWANPDERIASVGMPEYSQRYLAVKREEYVRLTVENETVLQVLARLNAARDVVAAELASLLRGWGDVERRQVFEHAS